MEVGIECRGCSDNMINEKVCSVFAWLRFKLGTGIDFGLFLNILFFTSKRRKYIHKIILLTFCFRYNVLKFYPSLDKMDCLKMFSGLLSQISSIVSVTKKPRIYNRFLKRKIYIYFSFLISKSIYGYCCEQDMPIYKLKVS